MILFVRQIQKLCVFHFDISWSFPLVLLPGILSAIVPIYERQVTETESPTAQNRDLCWFIPRLILRTECLRPNDISGTIANQVQRRNSRLLRVACDIAGQQTEEGNETSGRSTCQIEAGKTAAIVRQWQAYNQQHANRRHYQTSHSDQDPISESVSKIPASDQEDDFDDAAGSSV